MLTVLDSKEEGRAGVVVVEEGATGSVVVVEEGPTGSGVVKISVLVEW